MAIKTPNKKATSRKVPSKTAKSTKPAKSKAIKKSSASRPVSSPGKPKTSSRPASVASKAVKAKKVTKANKSGKPVKKAVPAKGKATAGLVKKSGKNLHQKKQPAATSKQKNSKSLGKAAVKKSIPQAVSKSTSKVGIKAPGPAPASKAVKNENLDKKGNSPVKPLKVLPESKAIVKSPVKKVLVKNKQEKPVIKKSTANAVVQKSAPSPAVVRIKGKIPSERPTRLNFKRVEFEYPVASAKHILFNYLSTATGLSEWFADKIDEKGDIFIFHWDSQQEAAKLVSIREDHHVRFRWLNKPEPIYFEFRIESDEITGDLALIITDFVDVDQTAQDSKLLWDKQIEDLFHVIGVHS